MLPVQQPAFNYQRRPFSPYDDDEDRTDNAPEQAASVPDTRGGADDETPPPYPYGMGRPVTYPKPAWEPPAPPSAPRRPNDLSGVQEPAVSNDARPLRAAAEYGRPELTHNQPTPYGPSAPTPPPVGYKKGPAQQQLEEMVQAGPRKSKLGMIAGAALGAAAGWVNASGRAHVATPNTRNMVYRAPGGGAWDEKLQQQQQLAGFEHADQQREIAATEAESRAAERESLGKEREAQAGYYEKHGKYLDEQAQTARLAESDRQKQQELQRIIAIGGKTPVIRSVPKTQPPPVGEWSYDADDPFKPGWRIYVRPSPGEEIDKETAEWLGVAANAEGKYYATSSNINAGVRGKVSAANAKLTDQRKRDEDTEHKAEFQQRMALLSSQIASSNAAREAATEDRRSKQLADIDKWKETEVTRIARDAHAQEGKDITTGMTDKGRSGDLYRRAADAMTQVNAVYARRIRDAGGNAADYAVTADEHGNYDWKQTSQPYGKGGSGSSTPPPVAAPSTPPPFGAPGSAGTASPPSGGGGAVLNMRTPPQAGGQAPAMPPEIMAALDAGKVVRGPDGRRYKKVNGVTTAIQ